MNIMCHKVASLVKTATPIAIHTHINLAYFFGGNLSHLRGEFSAIKDLIGHKIHFDALGLVDHGSYQPSDPQGWKCRQTFKLSGD